MMPEVNYRCTYFMRTNPIHDYVDAAIYAGKAIDETPTKSDQFLPEYEEPIPSFEELPVKGRQLTFNL